ncbi:hypothetical protein F8B43_5362 [Methylorubrum populi]|uniref:Uncharacterized protein n=1 Tax=Methylorubrum populi TaxID=223967 RepID=A0A833MUV0_9HYPH|nr:hypothetical protein F8B43_5362 [Methylorubrum populi]
MRDGTRRRRRQGSAIATAEGDATCDPVRLPRSPIAAEARHRAG